MFPNIVPVSSLTRLLVYFSPLYLNKIFCIGTGVHCLLFCHCRGTKKHGFIFISFGEIIEEGSHFLHLSMLKTKQTLLSQPLVECHVLCFCLLTILVPLDLFRSERTFYICFCLFFSLMPEYPKFCCRTCICLCWISQISVSPFLQPAKVSLCCSVSTAALNFIILIASQVFDSTLHRITWDPF